MHNMSHELVGRRSRKMYDKRGENRGYLPIYNKCFQQ